ncbi:hypothetical protein [Leifsonia virtsii]|uniref:Uncharacterized protein n=1 Tax=Leifsonia virtsii TaxID=3035915 RepID=A0ABT8IX10_9MICO|nr:hypothetical protein [Leifsonia virtsii]MDN4597351.1 hypothetical protein [Leifsonia virtsii]
MTARDTRRDIVDFGIGLLESWYPMPLAAASGPEWSRELAEALTADIDAQRRLSEELELARSRFRSIGNPTLTAAVWIPFPQIGRAGAAAVFSLAPVDLLGDPDTYEAALASPEVDPDGAESYYAVQTWRSQIDAGEVVGSHNLIAHLGAGGGAELEERVVAVVYPPGAAQAVQFVVSAENLGVFTDMVQDVQDLVSTLTVSLAVGPTPEAAPTDTEEVP